jgi:hypothetical protein
MMGMSITTEFSRGLLSILTMVITIPIVAKLPLQTNMITFLTVTQQYIKDKKATLMVAFSLW